MSGKRQLFNKWKRPWRILKGDTVFVREGKDKGKTGVVTKVDRNKEHVYVEGNGEAHSNLFAPGGGASRADLRDTAEFLGLLAPKRLAR